MAAKSSQAATANPPLYSVQEIREMLEALTNGLLHLDALLLHTCGESGESLRGLNDDAQDNYMWCASEKARGCRELAGKINDSVLDFFGSLRAAGNCFDASMGEIREMQETLTIGLAHLDALLLHTYGESGESLRGLNDDAQDNYMWCASDKARTCKELADKINDSVLSFFAEVRV